MWLFSAPFFRPSHLLKRLQSIILGPFAAAVSVSEWMGSMTTPTYRPGSDDPRLQPVEVTDLIDELVNEQLARGIQDRR